MTAETAKMVETRQNGGNPPKRLQPAQFLWKTAKFSGVPPNFRGTRQIFVEPAKFSGSPPNFRGTRQIFGKTIASLRKGACQLPKNGEGKGVN